MARGAAQAQRKRAQAAQPKRKQKAPSWEEQLFFSRLRRHAKVIYVLLAVVFAAGFVVLGVGSGSTGIGDVLSNLFKGGSSSSLGSRIKDDQKKINAHPRNMAPYLDLATLYQQKGDTASQITTLESAANVSPKNVDVLSQLASVYRAQAASAQTSFNDAQAALATNDATPPGLFDINSTLGQAFTADPLSQALKTKATDEYTKLGTAFTKAEQAYKRMATAARGTSQESTAELQLASVARDAFTLFTSQVSHAQIAVAAYQRYLKLEPNGVQANLARQTISQLQAFLPKKRR
jgi:tetratricopeptide (TPR) repeat protein